LKRKRKKYGMTKLDDSSVTDLAELKAGMYENTSLVLLILNVVGGGLACLIPYDAYLSIASKI